MQDETVQEDACWALSYLCEGSHDKVQAVIDTGIIPHIVELMSHSNVNVQVPAVRIIGTVVSGDDLQTQLVIDSGALSYLLTMLSSDDKIVHKEACWTISNITAGTKEQIGAVIDATIVPPLIDLLANGLFDIKREAAWANTNIVIGGSEAHVRGVVEMRAIPAVSDLLNCGETKMILVAMDALEIILEVGSIDVGYGIPYFTVFEESGGVKTLEMLQDSPDDDVYTKAVSILSRFFVIE